MSIPSSDLQYEAEKIFSNEGSKSISKCIAVGNINTGLFRQIANLAHSRGVKLRVKDSINKYINFPPLLRSLHTIFPDLRFDNDFLMYSAVREQYVPTVEYLLMDGGVDPLCRKGECLIQAYVHQSNMPLSRMLLDHIRTSSPEIPLLVMNTAVERKDWSFIRHLLTKGAQVSTEMLDAWFEQKVDRDWMLMRLYLRFSSDYVIQYRDKALARLCLDSRMDEQQEKESKRNMFSLLISYNMDVSSLLRDYADPKTLDEFTHLMMSEQSRGLYGPVEVLPITKNESKKRRKVENESEEKVVPFVQDA